MVRLLIWLAVGAFAVGTEGFMIAGILPGMAADLGVSVPAAGHLVTIFALTYAIASPVMAAATAGMARRRLLIGAMAVFALANLAAGFAPDYGSLAAARVLLAIAAGTFMPGASAYAAVAVAPERRGRALAFIYTGMTIAVALGAPLGTALAERFGWRASFLAVAVLSGLALIGMVAGLRNVAAAPAASLGRRLAVARRPEVLSALSVTVLALAGALGFNTFLGAFFQQVYGLTGAGIAALLLGVGVMGAIGNTVGGYAADRWNRETVLAAILSVLVLAFLAIAALAHAGAGIAGLWLSVALAGTWSLFGWAFPSVQQSRLAGIDPALAPITLSLNGSAIYLGSALGAALGAFTIDHASIRSIGWVGAGWELAALAVLAASSRGLLPGRRRTCTPAPAVPR